MNLNSSPTDWEVSQPVDSSNSLLEQLKLVKSTFELLNIALQEKDKLENPHVLGRFFHYIFAFEVDSRKYCCIVLN